MGKLKDVHIFSNEKGSVAKFFIAAALFSAAGYAVHILVSLIKKEPLGCGDLLVVFIIVALMTAVYFITGLLAYRTKIFPK